MAAEGGSQLSASESLELWAAKVQSDWAGPLLVPQLTRERIEGLVGLFKEGRLDNMVKVRILLACLFLPRRELESLHEPLQSLADVARNDDDEWVKVTALALGDCQGQLDTAALLQDASVDSLVRPTLESLWAGLADAHTPTDFRPLQEVFMHPDVLSPEALAARNQLATTTNLTATTATAVTAPTATAATAQPFVPRDPEDMERFPMAPPPLERLLSGQDLLRVDQGKAPRRPTAPANKPSAPFTVPPRHTHTATHTPHTPHAHHHTQPTHHAAGAAARAASGAVSAAGLNRAPSVSGPLLGMRSTKLKSLELDESIQLSAQASTHRGGHHKGAHAPHKHHTATAGQGLGQGGAGPLHEGGAHDTHDTHTHAPHADQDPHPASHHPPTITHDPATHTDTQPLHHDQHHNGDAAGHHDGAVGMDHDAGDHDQHHAPMDHDGGGDAGGGDLAGGDGEGGDGDGVGAGPGPDVGGVGTAGKRKREEESGAGGDGTALVGQGGDVMMGDVEEI